MEKVVIIGFARTPIGAYGGALKDVPVYRLGSIVLAEAAKRAGVDPVLIEDVIMGSAYQNGECANGARMAVLDAGWPDSVPGVVLDRRCCSGVEAIFWGAMKIESGNADIVVAGGMDSMSQGNSIFRETSSGAWEGRSMKNTALCPEGTVRSPCGEFLFMIEFSGPGSCPSRSRATAS